uniref:ZNF333_0 protein n=1 Tax=Fopius arisanus TaxID=64838 RepID=A0A0C9Q8E6_9HYME
MYSCKLCHLDFDTSKSYISHVRLFHPTSVKFHCENTTCLRVFKSVNSLKSHIDRVHKRKTQLEKDQFSSKKFKSNKKDPASKEIENVNGVVEGIENAVENKEPLQRENVTGDFRSSTSHNQSDALPPGISQKWLMYAAKIYSHLDIPRSKSLEILNDTRNFIKDLLQDNINNFDKVFNPHELITIEKMKVEATLHLQNFSKAYSSQLDCLDSEHKIIKEFENRGTYIAPESYLLGEREDFRKNKQNIDKRRIPVTAQMIRLRYILRNFFELPLVLEETLSEIDLLKMDSLIISNFISSDLWKELSKDDENKIVMPLFFYIDDYENNNPLGSHRGISKCSAVYVSIPGLPTKFCAKLENIFLFLLFNSLDGKNFKNSIIFNKIREELQFLETEGITINYLNGEKRLYFRLALIIADNLGMHQLLGFRECFNSGKICRFCLIDYQDINKVFKEDECELRTVVNYENDLRKNDPKETGIMERCVLEGIGGFHPLKNLAVDVVHDILEGVCRYDLALILSYNIKKNFFSLTQLNNLIGGFCYAPIKNKPTEIFASHLKNKCINMSASEMLTLIVNLPVIIGHFVPHDDEVWQLLLSLRKITIIVIDYQFSKSVPDILEAIITEYLTLLSTLFPYSLKPKHHLLLHYPRVMRLCGPLWKICTMRFEAKHREGKTASRSTVSRINVCKTIAIKHQLRQNYRFLKKCTPTNIIYDFKLLKTELLRNLACYVELHEKLLASIVTENGEIKVVKRVDVEGTKFDVRSIIMIPSEEGPIFYKINKIIIHPVSHLVFIVQKLLFVWLDEHTECFKLVQKPYQWSILGLSDLFSCKVTNLVRASNGRQFVLKNWL